jgi:hypothetical protein
LSQSRSLRLATQIREKCGLNAAVEFFINQRDIFGVLE